MRLRSTLIGVTGPIGCGKSTITGWLAEGGAVVIDADVVAREVVEPGSPTLARVADRFGRELVDADGALDRAALGRIVFADPEALADLEAIVHPAVRPLVLRRIAEASTAAAAVVVIEAIKLVEGGLADLCDEVWLVTCDPAIQRDRLADRGLVADEIDRRTTAQLGLADRIRARATRTIETSGTPAMTRVAVERALAEAMSRASDRGG